jgi:hypothetical protein
MQDRAKLLSTNKEFAVANAEQRREIRQLRSEVAALERTALDEALRRTNERHEEERERERMRAQIAELATAQRQLTLTLDSRESEGDRLCTDVGSGLRGARRALERQSMVLDSIIAFAEHHHQGVGVDGSFVDEEQDEVEDDADDEDSTLAEEMENTRRCRHGATRDHDEAECVADDEDDDMSTLSRSDDGDDELADEEEEEDGNDDENKAGDGDNEEDAPLFPDAAAEDVFSWSPAAGRRGV